MQFYFIFVAVMILLILVVYCLFKISKLQKGLEETNYNVERIQQHLITQLKNKHVRNFNFIPRNELVFYQDDNKHYNSVKPAFFEKIEVSVNMYSYSVTHSYCIRPFELNAKKNVDRIYTLTDVKNNNDLSSKLLLSYVPYLLKEKIMDEIKS